MWVNKRERVKSSRGYLVSLVLKKIKVDKLDNYEIIYYNIIVRVVDDKYIY